MKSVQQCVNKWGNIQEHLLNFIENENVDLNESAKNLYNEIKKEQLNDKKELFHLLLMVTNDHCRSHDFINKFQIIIKYLKDDIRQSFENKEIFDFFKSNKFILLILIEAKIIDINENIAKDIKSSNELKSFFAPEIKPYFPSEVSQLEDNFEEKRQIGENDSLICSFIRSDSAEKFISYVNQANLPLSVSIKSSIFETNPFLLSHETTLIEYAAFYGSIQIFQYLKIENIKLTPSLWLYAIHSNSAELIHILENAKIWPKDESFCECLIESIKCNHACIANYISDYYFKGIFIVKIGYYDISLRYDYETIIVLLLLLNYYSFSYDSNIIINGRANCFENIISFLSNNENVIDVELTSISKVNPQITQFEIHPFISKIGPRIFEGCSCLTAISFPPSLKSIGDFAFHKCYSLTKVNIPFLVSEIGYFAFANCYSLMEITFENHSSLREIGFFAFTQCKSLKEITFPKSLKKIGMNAFHKCESLTKLSISSSVNLKKLNLNSRVKIVKI